jgi:membrane protein DedA with SNARE-associated domain
MAPTSITSACDRLVTLTGFLIAHGSALILPLSVIEGPIVSIATGILAAQGYFDWYWALPLLVAGDLVGDVACYWIGRAGLTRLPFLRRHLGIGGALTPAFQNKLRHNATRMLFVGKWTHSIGCLVLVGGGMLRLNLVRFVCVNLLATVPKSVVLFSFGYFAADEYPFIEQHGMLGTGLACIAGLAAIALILWRTDCIWARR